MARTAVRRMSCGLLALLPVIAPVSPVAAEDALLPARERVPLSSLLAAGQSTELRGRWAALDIAVPPLGEPEVVEATLTLNYVTSRVLVPDRSQIKVELNGAALATLPVQPSQAPVIAEIELAPSMLSEGWNRFRIGAIQNAAGRCTDLDAPELWTQIDPGRSFLTIDRIRPPSRTTLAAFNDPLFPAFGAGQPLVVLTPGAAPTEEQLRWGSLVAQGFALRLAGRPAGIRHAPAASLARPQATRDGRPVLIGTRADLQGILPDAALAGITGAYLGLHAVGGGVLLVVSGLSGDEVTQAALTFADTVSPLPDAATAVLGRRGHGGLLRLRDEPLTAGSGYRFTDLGYVTRTVAGPEPDRVDIRVQMPDDLYATETQQAVLNLHISYAAGLREDSAVNVLVNGAFANVFPLDQLGGATPHRRPISVPMRMLRPGPNVIAIEPILVPADLGRCVLTDGRNVRFTVFDDSTLELPRFHRLGLQPDLSLFASTGFPYAGGEEQGRARLQLAADDGDTVAAAWTLMGRLAQSAGQVLTEIDLSFGSGGGSDPLLVVGALEDLNPRWLAAAPVRLRAVDPATPWSIESLNDAPPPGAAVESGWLDRMLEAVRSAVALPGRPRTTDLRVGAGTGALLAFRAPDADRTVTLLTAASREELPRVAVALVQPGVWDRLSGDTARWRADGSGPWTARLGPTFHVGPVQYAALAHYYFSARPLHWTGLILVLLVAMAIVTRLVLARVRRRYDV